MGLEKSARESEPVLERWDEELSEELDRGQAGMEVFRLSGGVLRPSTKTSNRIDGLLVRMLENKSSSKYLGDIDKNLDYLYTHLQLDLIERVARDVSSKEEEDVQKDLPEPVISLERARSSV